LNRTDRALKKRLTTRTLPALALSLACAASAFAADAPASLTVIGTIEAPATGHSSLEASVIEQLPRGGGSLNEILGLFPDVQLGEAARTTERAAEILPPPISISGGKTFQNNFSIDGVGNNSLLDPVSVNPFSIDNVPGHPQETFLDSSLIEEINLFDSNVPARLGRFTGGAVEVRTKSPGTEFGGRLDYRTTRSDWTSFRLPEDAEGTTPQKEPEFSKQDAGVSFDIPLSEDSGLLVSWRVLHSKIPVELLGQREQESRQLQNFFLKHSLVLSGSDLLETTLLYSPYRSRQFVPNSRNSQFTTRGGGLLLGSTLTRFTAGGEWDIKGSFRHSENSREASENWLQWATAGSHDWGRLRDSSLSFEGGFGDLEKTQTSMELAASWRSNLLTTGEMQHRITGGMEIQRLEGSFDRPRDVTVYDGARVTIDVPCGADSLGCAQGEQFFTQRKIYRATSLEVAILQAALHLEDELRYGRLSVRPGLRLEADDFMDNLNPAPRLALSFDVFGKARTRLHAGANRYYGQNLLTFKLREALQPYLKQSRTSFQNQLTDWGAAPFQGGNLTRFSELDTPYSDELMLGLDQKLGDGLLSAKYVRREGKDEFARQYGELQPDGLRSYRMNNNGTSRHESWRLSYERSWSRQSLLANLTYQKSTQSNKDYDSLLDEDALGDRVWFGDRILYKTELPKSDYSRPWTANLLYSLQVLPDLRFTNHTRFRSGYRSLEPTGEVRALDGAQQRIDPLSGEPIFEALPVYKQLKRSSALVFDWRLDWALGGSGLSLNLEVFNVFNTAVETGIENRFETGRQLWAGGQWRF